MTIVPREWKSLQLEPVGSQTLPLQQPLRQREGIQTSHSVIEFGQVSLPSAGQQRSAQESGWQIAEIDGGKAMRRRVKERYKDNMFGM